MNYYNEYDKKTAAWLRELIKQGLIPQGEVDERSITEVTPTDLRGFCQCHFFAGIGGWSLALQLAGWPADRQVWTGSCPCQPFSSAGKHKGVNDERHLWPVFARLIAECRPPVVFGEQVESAIGHGWLDGVHADMEKEGYAVGACVLGAHSVGAPHRRQRLYWVAENTMGNAQSNGREQWRAEPRRPECASAAGCNGAVADTNHIGRQPGYGKEGGERGEVWFRSSVEFGNCGQNDTVANTEHNDRGTDQPGRGSEGGNADGWTSGVVESESERSLRRSSQIECATGGQNCNASDNGVCGGDVFGAVGDAMQQGREGDALGLLGECGATAAPWGNYRVIQCRDGKARRIPVEPALQWLAYGIPGGVVYEWDNFVRQIKERFMTYANAKKANPVEVLQSVRNTIGQEVIQRCAGGFNCVQEAEVLFSALCQSSRELGDFFDSTASGICRPQSGEMCDLRECSDTVKTTSRSSSEWGSVGQSERELVDSLRVLSQTGTLEEAKSLISSMSGFPLSYKVPARVVRLRGYGNAIVPQVAAEFITAWMEVS